MIRRARFILCAAAVFLVQTTVVHRFTHGTLRPDLVLLLAAFVALEADAPAALACAFCLGLLRDLGSAGPLGATSLVLVPATGILVMLRSHLLRDSPWTDLALTFGYVLGVGVVGALLAWLPSAGGELSGMLPRAVGQAAFTTALAPLVSALLARAGIVSRSDTAFG